MSQKIFFSVLSICGERVVITNDTAIAKTCAPALTMMPSEEGREIVKSLIPAFSDNCPEQFVVIEHGLSASLSEDELFAIIRHEIGHIRHKHLKPNRPGLLSCKNAEKEADRFALMDAKAKDLLIGIYKSHMRKFHLTMEDNPQYIASSVKRKSIARHVCAIVTMLHKDNISRTLRLIGLAAIGA